MIQPPFLKKGDKVAIVSTARKISLEEIKHAIHKLEEWELEVVIGKTIGLEKDQFAGSDTERLKDFQRMLNDQSIKAIICARGGYGTVRILDKINFSSLKKYPKWIVGYSDITYLHTYLQTKLGMQSLHATMPINFAKNTTGTLDSLRQALFGEPLSYTFFQDHRFNKAGTAKGIISGGNLSILYSLTGTDSGFSGKGILFMEDLDEYLYHIDRMMYNLDRSGMLQGPDALVVGGMTDMNDNTIPFGAEAEKIIHQVVKKYDYPVAYGLPFGHSAHNLTLMFGSTCTLKVEKNEVSLSFN